MEVLSHPAASDGRDHLDLVSAILFTIGALAFGLDQSAQLRRSLLAKVNIGRQQIDMVEDDYRQMLLDTTGQASLKTCSDQQLARVVERLKQLGFRPIQQKGSAGVAQHPMARKARALWISLFHLGVVRNQGEPAFEAFAKRCLDCDKLVWARQSDGFKLIEALKNMAVRNGWTQVDHKGRPLEARGLQESLCMAILQRLKTSEVIPDEWTIDEAAYRLCGIDCAAQAPFTAEKFQRLAIALGAKLRELGKIRGGEA
jgi:hypothetical protein